MKMPNQRNSDCTVSQPTSTTFEAAMYELAAYKDTGMTPEEINRILDAYGRGMTLRGEIGERVEIVREIGTERLKVLAQAEKDNRLKVLPCEIGDIVYAAETSPVIPLVVTDVGLWLVGCDGEDWESLSNIGKTVFLTREEAEAALKQEEAEND